MQNVIQAKSNEALQAGYEHAKHSANVSGLELARTGAAWLEAQHAQRLEMVAVYEAEIAARISAHIAANAADFSAAQLEAAYYAEMDRIEEIEVAKIAALEARWEEMLHTGEAELYWNDWD